MFRTPYLYQWRYVTQMINPMSLSDTFWLDYIVDIQIHTNHSISKLVQSRMWTPSRRSILRGGHSWKPYFYFSHIWISYMKKSCMLLIDDEKICNYGNFHHKNNILSKKSTWKTFTTFLHPNCYTQKSVLILIFEYPNQT